MIILDETKLNDKVAAQKVTEAHAYLDSTDYKDLPRYKAKESEDLEVVFAKRDVAREFIRANEVQL